ncbi:MAG: hypothetical protein KatS3mg077_2020 [Candidatus Binatia bacterium]|nr:MAG: hypothetical protein KatS3mg077_2020 [Candidatus Binatia bacterium]
METVTNVLAVAGLASGGYGVAEAARNGMYASAAIGAILLAAGAYRLLSGNGERSTRSGGSAGEDGRGVKGRSAQKALLRDLARANPGTYEQGTGTWELWRACTNGNVGACSELEATNEADLAAGLDHIRRNFPDILDRMGGDLRIVWESSPEFVNELSGTTDFLSGTVRLSRAYSSRQDFVTTLAHELLHSGDGIVGRALTNFQDKFFPLQELPVRLGARHTAIYLRAREIGATFRP